MSFLYSWKFVCFNFIILLLSNSLFAQLSPGDLHTTHSFLEGVENCTQCHEQGQKLNPAKCLDCHTILKDRIDNNKGLHSNPAFQECENCHVEHQGRDYDLVFWDKGKDNFNHNLTGYSLKGKHKTLKCNECHNGNHISDKTFLREKKKDLDRTFLGLDKNCLSCHHDEHRGQLANKCLTCHNMAGWKPAPGFDHNKTNYPLTGLHKKVQCNKCHKTLTDSKFREDRSYLHFANVKHSICTDCHKDPHNNKFGQNCKQCHNTSGWKNYNEKQFNHNKTRYPLKGKHAKLRCVSCHKPGKPLKINRFSRCSDCHADFHQGQFADRKEKGACEECHTVNGFKPSLFNIEKHQQSDYPLKGSHLAVPCFLCHKTIALKNRAKTIQFKFKSNQCLTCHDDVHKGTTIKFVMDISTISDQCAYCHKVASWQDITFNHDKTGFKLEGRHKKIKCRRCHKPENSTDWQFEGIQKECIACHKDIHQNQFSGNKKTDCARCHTPVDWLAEKFDHEKHSMFSLKGTHQYVSCSGCHKPEKRNGTTFVRYKPLNTKCESCHT